MKSVNFFKLFFCMLVFLSVLPAVPAYADKIWGKEVTLPESSWEGEIPFWAQDTGEGLEKSFEPKAAFPEKFDLRDQGYVTSVKLQNPYSTCWSFGAIGAAETSIIASGFEDNSLDLSEKHLVWFAMHPITEADELGVEPGHSQLGEGIHVITESEDDPNAAYVATNPILVSSLWSSGVGPLYEELFPYQGKEGFTALDFLKTKEKWMEWSKNDLIKQFGTEEKALEEIQMEFPKYKTVDDYLEWEYTDRLSGYENGTTPNSYSNADDWSMPEVDEAGDSNRNLFVGYTLRDGNVMPAFTNPQRNEDGTKKYDAPHTLNEEGMNAVKTELMAGRGVYIMFKADTALPGEESEPMYINLDNWAHYTYAPLESNHAVFIVGWDDTYSKDNFNTGISERFGDKQPPADGAWIVRNSWGMKDGTETTADGQILGKNNWGVDGSGYFYISYYDKSIDMAETFVFDKDFEGTVFYPHQYDYMPAISGFFRCC